MTRPGLQKLTISFIFAVEILDSAYRGHDFIVKPLHSKLDFLHLHILKIGLKIHVFLLKILSLAMPMHVSTFHQDFSQLKF